MSQDPEEKLVIERRSADMKAAYELLAEFGAQLHGFDPGVTAFIGERPQMIVSGQGRGAWGENLSFTREEWKWLRPLLEELRDLRSKAQATQDAQGQIEASWLEARNLLGQLNRVTQLLAHKHEDYDKLAAELCPIRDAARYYGRFDRDVVKIIQQAQRDEVDLNRAAKEMGALRDELEALKRERDSAN